MLSSVPEQGQDDMWETVVSSAQQRRDKKVRKEEAEIRKRMEEEAAAAKEEEDFVRHQWVPHAEYVQRTLQSHIDSFQQALHATDSSFGTVTALLHAESTIQCPFSVTLQGHESLVRVTDERRRIRAELLCGDNKKLFQKCRQLQRKYGKLKDLIFARVEKEIDRLAARFDPLETHLWTADDGSKILRISTVVTLLSDGRVPTKDERWDLGGWVLSYISSNRNCVDVSDCDGKVSITVPGEDDDQPFEINAYRPRHLRMLIRATVPWVASTLGI